MIIEDKWDEYEVVDFDYEQLNETPQIQVSCEQTNEFTAFIQNYQRIQDQEIHFQLQSDIIDHLWRRQGDL